MVVWDTASGTPIKSIFNPHPHGVLGMDMSPDALFIVTLSARGPGEDGGSSEPQTISLWEWTHPERETALFTSVIEDSDLQKARSNYCMKKTCVDGLPLRADFGSLFSILVFGANQLEAVTVEEMRSLPNLRAKSPTLCSFCYKQSILVSEQIVKNNSFGFRPHI